MNSFALTIVYNARNLRVRWVTTLLTVAGIAMVVAVFVLSLMLSEGLRRTMTGTGASNNVIVVTNGAQNEIQSAISREHANIVLSDPAVNRDSSGTLIATTDTVVIISLKKRSDGQPSNVTLRGVSSRGYAVKKGVSLIAGRRPAPGTREVIIGEAIRAKFANTDLGATIRLSGGDWNVVGIFSAGNSALGSEIWADVDILMPAIKRDRFSTITFELAPNTDFKALQERIQNDARLSLLVQSEPKFYESQSEALGKFVTIFGTTISIVFSLAAIVGAMITMYSAVAGRMREIGILRAIGFTPLRIFQAFFVESLFISLIGGICGITIAALGAFTRVTTTNFSSFSELSFGFALTPRIVVSGLIFALIMGAIGGTFPALRAARLKLLAALRNVG